MCYPTHIVRTLSSLLIGAAVMVITIRSHAATPADVAAADALFREARAAAKRGDYAAACPKFRESYRLDPTVGTLLNTADCEEHDGHLDDAKSRFQDALARLGESDDRITYVRSRIRALDERLSETQKREAPPPAPEPAVAPAAPAPQPIVPPAANRALPIALGSAGVAAGIATGVFVGLMFHEKHLANAHCAGSECDQAGLDATSSGKRDGMIGGVTFGVAAVALAVGTFLFFRQPDKIDHVAIGDYVLGGGL